MLLDLVIYSKDRACQLDLLLRSLKLQFAEWADARVVILYTYSSRPLQRAYELVKGEHQEFEFVCERDQRVSFKEATLKLLGQRPYLAFLVDDDVFKAPFTLAAPEVQAFESDPQIMCVSLRMDPGMDYVYTQDREVSVPAFRQGNIWDWTVSDGDWGYPMSLDGNIFRSDELIPLIERVAFHDPNSFESALAREPLSNPLAVCFDVARIINLPVNRVQDTVRNRHGGGDARWLNFQFLSGQRLSLATVDGVRPRSPHHELPLKWEPWGGAPAGVRAAAVLDTGAAAVAAASRSAVRSARLTVARARGRI